MCVSYHAVAEDWGEMTDSEINVLDKYIEKEALHAMMAILTEKQRRGMTVPIVGVHSSRSIKALSFVRVC